jgi:hypothetical protein
MKTNILPRPARDKHRETSKKAEAFPAPPCQLLNRKSKLITRFLYLCRAHRLISFAKLPQVVCAAFNGTARPERVLEVIHGAVYEAHVSLHAVLARLRKRARAIGREEKPSIGRRTVRCLAAASPDLALVEKLRGVIQGHHLPKVTALVCDATMPQPVVSECHRRQRNLEDDRRVLLRPALECITELDIDSSWRPVLQAVICCRNVSV